MKTLLCFVVAAVTLGVGVMGAAMLDVSLDLNAVDLLSRSKRQTLGVPVNDNCLYCPTNALFLMPNWNDCATFYECNRGEKYLVGCSEVDTGFNYFNPTTLSCETAASSNNVCLFRG